MLLDMLGTLVELQDPVPRLRAALRERTGVDVGDEAAARGFGAEIAYYLDHHMEGRDRDSLEDLRDRCAAIMDDALGVDGLAREDIRAAMLASLEFAPFPDVEPTLAALRRLGLRLVIASNWDWSLPEWVRQTGLDRLVDGAASSAVVGAAKPAPRRLPGGAAAGGSRAGGRDPRGRFARGGRPRRARGGRPRDPPPAPRRAARGRRDDQLARRAPLPTLGAAWRADAPPRWPAWYAIMGFVVALVATFVVLGIAAAATGSTEDSPSFTTVATLIQEAIFAGTAVLFASFVATPRPWHFGLRKTRFWPAVGWAALALFSFYVFTIIYSLVVHPHAEQNVTKSLGADQGTFGLIAAGVMVIAVAPVAEEFFFRGFFYKALRGRFGVIAAALMDGALFGLIHFDPSASSPLAVIPPLAVLGFSFCLVYEQTGSIFPTIALHSLNNTIAYGAQADGWGVSAVVGPLMLLACILAPRLIPPLRTAPALR